MLKTVTVTMLIITLIMPDIVRYIRGRFVSPTALSMDEPKLYRRLNGVPRNIISRYSVAYTICSSGVCISSSKSPARKNPTAPTIMPTITLSTMDVCRT